MAVHRPLVAMVTIGQLRQLSTARHPIVFEGRLDRAGKYPKVAKSNDTAYVSHTAPGRAHAAYRSIEVTHEFLSNRQDRFNSSGSLARFAAMRRASSRVSRFMLAAGRARPRNRNIRAPARSRPLQRSSRGFPRWSRAAGSVGLLSSQIVPSEGDQDFTTADPAGSAACHGAHPERTSRRPRLTPPPARRAPRAPWSQDHAGDKACRAGA